MCTYQPGFLHSAQTIMLALESTQALLMAPPMLQSYCLYFSLLHAQGRNDYRWPCTAHSGKRGLVPLGMASLQLHVVGGKQGHHLTSGQSLISLFSLLIPLQ